MKKDNRCDFCRAGVPKTAEALREYVRSRGGSIEAPQHLMKIAKHIERFAGPYSHAMINSSPGSIPIHVLEVPPTPDRPFKILITAGMSDLPMIPPPGTGIDLAWAELMICLPADWPLRTMQRRGGRRATGSKRQSWPHRLLFELARYPHRYDQWIWYHHTFGCGDEPIAPGTRFDSVLFHVTDILPQEFWCLDVGKGRQIHFLSLIPLYPEELGYCRTYGAHALIDLFQEQSGGTGLPELVEPDRPKVVQATTTRAP